MAMKTQMFPPPRPLTCSDAPPPPQLLWSAQTVKSGSPGAKVNLLEDASVQHSLQSSKAMTLQTKGNRCFKRRETVDWSESRARALGWKTRHGFLWKGPFFQTLKLISLSRKLLQQS